MQKSHLFKGLEGEGIRLSLCENPFPPLKEVIAEAKKELKKANLYGSKFANNLRSELSKFLNIPKKNIFVNAGSELILRQIFAKYGGNALLFAPSYVLFEEISKNKKFILLKEKENFEFKTDFKIPKNTSIFPIVNPNNPTGQTFPIEELRRHIERHKKTIFLFDEAYIDFAGKSALDYIFEFDNVIITRTFSKAFSLAGLRIGYAIMPEKIAKFFRNNNDPYPISRVAEKAAIVSLKNYSKIKKRVKKLLQYSANMQAKLKKFMKIFPSKTHFFLAKVKNAELFAKKLAERKIYISALKQKGLSNNFLRFVALPPKDAKIVINAIKDILSVEK